MKQEVKKKMFELLLDVAIEIAKDKRIAGADRVAAIHVAKELTGIIKLE